MFVQKAIGFPISSFTKKLAKAFSGRGINILNNQIFILGGPYNPQRYKDYFVPRTLPKNDEIYKYVRSVHSIPNSPVRNVRHINPVRESGPLPSYNGPYTMEDVRKMFFTTNCGRDFCYT